MKTDISIEIKVLKPLNGVAMLVQRGRDKLLSPATKSTDELVFEFTITVDLSTGTLNFLGEYAQGPKDARFIYVNSGSYAGQPGTCWSRRAKISLMGITRSQVEQVLSSPGSVLYVEFQGAGKDGGPTCASVKGVEWKVKAK